MQFVPECPCSSNRKGHAVRPEYAEIYRLLNEKAKDLDVFIDPSYRYVIVDKFFDFVADEHVDEISSLQSQIRENVGDAYA